MPVKFRVGPEPIAGYPDGFEPLTSELLGKVQLKGREDYGSAERWDISWECAVKWFHGDYRSGSEKEKMAQYYAKGWRETQQEVAPRGNRPANNDDARAAGAQAARDHIRVQMEARGVRPGRAARVMENIQVLADNAGQGVAVMGPDGVIRHRQRPMPNYRNLPGGIFVQRTDNGDMLVHLRTDITRDDRMLLAQSIFQISPTGGSVRITMPDGRTGQLALCPHPPLVVPGVWLDRHDFHVLNGRQDAVPALEVAPMPPFNWFDPAVELPGAGE